MEICNETSTTKYEGGGGAKIEPPFTNVVSTCKLQFHTLKLHML